MVACWLFPSLGNEAAKNGRSVFTFTICFYVEIVKNTPPPSKPVLPKAGRRSREKQFPWRQDAGRDAGAVTQAGRRAHEKQFSAAPQRWR